MMVKRFLAIVHKELRRLWRDRDLRLILFAAPLLGVVLFYATYSAQAIREIPTAVVDLDRSAHSREIYAEINKTEELKVVATVDTVREMEELIRKGRVTAGVVIPENFSRDISHGESSRILLVVDGSNIIYANNASTAMLGVTRTLGAEIGIKQLLAKGVHYSQAQQAYMSVTFTNQPWFNPGLNYAFFLMLALTLNIWQQCCTIASSTGVIGEKGVPSWLQIRASGVSRWFFFSSKACARIGLFMVILLPVYYLAFSLLGQIPACGHLTLIVFSGFFTVALDGLGTLVSSIARSSIDATRFGMVIALPSFIISGYTWPLEAMPQWLQRAAWFFPQTWFFQGFNLLVFKDPGLNVVHHYCMMLAVFAAVCYGSAAVFMSFWEDLL